MQSISYQRAKLSDTEEKNRAELWPGRIYKIDKEKKKSLVVLTIDFSFSLWYNSGVRKRGK